MKLRTIGAVGAGAIGLTVVSVASPAMAAPDCGAVPAGATLTILGGTTCQIDFAAAGSYTWTLPTGVAGLQALLVGGGSGALGDTNLGYAGDGGSVLYVDYSAAPAGTSATIVVGAGGASSNTSPTGGAASTVTVSAVTSTATGGASGPSSFCEPEGSTIFAGNGDGAGGTISTFGDPCETTYAPGINPSVDANDSFSNPRPAVFSTLNADFGLGGRVLITADTLPSDASLAGTGEGANMHYNGTLDQFDNGNAVGGSGRVVFRFTAPEAAALAVTGVDAGATVATAGLAAAFGALLLLLAARRRRKNA